MPRSRLKSKFESETQTYPVNLGGNSLADLVKAGQYGYVNPNITDEHFPVFAQVARCDLLLVPFERPGTSKQVLSELDRDGMRVGTMAELAAIGGQHRGVVIRESPIVALGSVWTDRIGDRHVGCLWEDSHERDLDLSWFAREWHGGARFLAVLK